MNGLPWFRMYGEAIDDDKLRLLAFEDRWHFVAILCCKNQGVLDSHPETLDRRVAVKLGLQLRDADEVKRRLMEVGLIDENWQPKAWDKRQFSSDSSAERTRKWREKNEKRTRKRHRDAPLASQSRHRDAVDADADADADITSTSTTVDVSARARAHHRGEALPECPEWLDPAAWAGFVSHRKALRKPLTPHAAALTLRDLDKARGYGHNPTELVEVAVQSGWQGCVFADRHFRSPGTSQEVPDFGERRRGETLVEHAERLRRLNRARDLALPDDDPLADVFAPKRLPALEGRCERRH